MKSLSIKIGLAAATLPAAPIYACPPPPIGYVEPTREEALERSLSHVTDIVYGVVEHSGQEGEPSAFKVHHVYRGSLRKGDTIRALTGWGHPAPMCVGMRGEAPPSPVGAFGVIAFDSAGPQLNFIKPDDVQIMIGKGWIQSARAR